MERTAMAKHFGRVALLWAAIFPLPGCMGGCGGASSSGGRTTPSTGAGPVPRHGQSDAASPEAHRQSSQLSDAAGDRPEHAAATADSPRRQQAPKLAAVDKSANAPIRPGDWAQWGGTSYRNNVPQTAPLPTAWNVGEFDRNTGKWLRQKAKNVKWVASLGDTSYGNPVVADGKVFVGSNNGAGYLKRYPPEVDLGCLLCFRESDGALLWQHSSEKLPTGNQHDWERQGICCAPCVERDRLWFVTSRGEVRCLDTQGFYDGEDDGPVQNEWGRLFDLAGGEDAGQGEAAAAAAELEKGRVSTAVRDRFGRAGAPLPNEVRVEPAEPRKRWSLSADVAGATRQFEVRWAGPKLSAFLKITPQDTHEADVVWVFDMMAELGVRQHNMCSCSVTTLGDILFVNTSNGVDETEENVPAPDAPSFLAMDKHSGKVLWTDHSPGTNILHGQWSSPAAGVLGGQPQVIFAGGDGWLYSFRADRGRDGKPELLWKFDCNPKQSKWRSDGGGTRNSLLATPVIYDGLVYVAVGQDPEAGDGPGRLWCVDPTRRGDVSPELAVRKDDPGKPIPHRRTQAVIPEQNEVAIPNPDSAAVWCYAGRDRNNDGTIDFKEEMHRSMAMASIANDLLFIADFAGLFHCLDAKTGKVHWTHDMFAAVWGSPLIAADHVYVGDEDGDVAVFGLSADPKAAMTRKEGTDELAPISEMQMGSSVYSTPIVANGALFISTSNKLFALQASEAAK